MTRVINDIAKTLEIPGIRVFANKVSSYSDGINLTIGQPDFPTPENIRSAAIEAIRKGKTGYSHNAGLMKLRESISSFFADTYGFHYDSAEEIVVTNGASEAIDSVLRTIIRKGDEIIIPSPSYSGYEPLIRLNGGVPVYIDVSDSNFKVTPEKLIEAITDKTKAIIFNYPSNPTGISLSQQETAALVDIIMDKDFFIISDEIYSENTFSGEHTSFGSFREIRDRLFLIHGLSKSHAMTGWRLGYVLGPADLIRYVLRVHLNNSICASLPSQYAAIEALDHTRSFPQEMNETYKARRDFIYDRLSTMGLKCNIPTGAFYIFPNVSHTGLDDLEFATRLLEEEHVAVVPGSTFSNEGAGFIRVSYANSMANLEEGMERMERFMATL
ncbi:aminotransferase class I/II-fold pyridoxal phosphate-dependent enzyme [Salinicoccus jeotgali]|uniref:Aminotransferase n=1 Tax=Salinicoccus jeotgali TaxID=381634 RepID=A0ABP7EF93_9STAP